MDEDRIPSEYDADDVEGHRIHQATTDDDSVEGHRMRPATAEDEDDVEGHRIHQASPAVHDDGTGEGISSL